MKYFLFVFLIHLALALKSSEQSKYLKGIHLHACTLIEFPYIKYAPVGHQRTQGFSGVAIEYLKALQDEMGFSITLQKWNNTFREFVAHMGSCSTNQEISTATRTEKCACDIGVGAFTMTDARIEKIDFLWPFANENHRMITRSKDLRVVDHGSLAYMFNTFSLPVWLLIVLALLVYACGTAAFGDIKPICTAKYPNHRPLVRARAKKHMIGDIQSRKRARHDYERSYSPTAPSTKFSGATKKSSISFSETSSTSYSDRSVRYYQSGSKQGMSFITWARPRVQRLVVAVIYTFALFIGQPVEADSAGQRISSIHKIAWRLLSLTAGIFLFCLYNASLTVLLFESVKESQFRSLDDVKDCLISPDRVTFIGGGASQDLWRNAIVSKGYCEQGETKHVADSIEDGLNLLRTGKADFFYSLEGAVLSVVNRRCDEFAIVGEPFFSTSIGFIVPKNSSIQYKLSKATRVLRERDAFYSAKQIAMRTPCSDQSAATITLDRLSFFFAAYFTCAILLILYRTYKVTYGNAEG